MANETFYGWHNQPRTGHLPNGKCCAGCAGALEQRQKNGINPPKKKRWDTKLGK